MNILVVFLLLISSSQAVLKLDLGGFVAYDPVTNGDRVFATESGIQMSHLSGRPGTGYFVTLGIGTPPQNLSFLVDTGSSNLAVAGYADPLLDKYFKRKLSSSYRASHGNVDVVYTVGEWSGELASDLITLPSKHGHPRVKIGVILRSSEFFINASHWHGILGLAYNPLARPDSSVTPFFDSLYEQRIVDHNSFSLQLCAAVKPGAPTKGAMVLGGSDDKLYKGSMHYVPLHKQWYYEILLVNVALGGQSLGLPCSEYNNDKTIVDSGTSALRLPSKVFAVLTNRLGQYFSEHLSIEPSDRFFAGVDQLCWRSGSVPWHLMSFIDLQLLKNQNTSVVLHLAPQHYMRPDDDTNPQSINYERECFKFGIASSSAGTVLGAVVMEAFFVHFDRANDRLGFALSSCAAKDPSPAISEESIQGTNYFNCAWKKQRSHHEDMARIVAYCLAGVCVVCVIPLAVVGVISIRRKLREHSTEDTEQLVETECVEKDEE